MTFEPATVLAVLIRVAVALVAVGTAVSLVKVSMGEDVAVIDLGSRFELHTDASLPTWFASMLLLSSVPLLVLMALRNGPERGKDRIQWAGLAALVLVFSLDEVSTFHEYMSAVLDVEVFGFAGSYNWVVFGVPFVAALAVLYFPFVARLESPLRPRLVLVAVLYFGGALGVEMVNANTASTLGYGTYWYVLGTMVEESLELAGALLLLYALLDHLKERRYSIHLAIAEDRGDGTPGA